MAIQQPTQCSSRVASYALREYQSRESVWERVSERESEKESVSERVKERVRELVSGLGDRFGASKERVRGKWNLTEFLWLQAL